MADDFNRAILNAAVSLREMGFAVHWLHPNTKRPIGQDWQDRTPASVADLRATHQPGYNLGVRLGEPSLLLDGTYLHTADVDIRIPDLADEAWAALRAVLPIDGLPTVASGSGGESRHLYFTSTTPLRGRTILRSEGKHRRAGADGREVWSYDWEVEIFGTGKQVVLPPSVHPDTGLPYTWIVPFDATLLAMGLSPLLDTATIEAAGIARDEVYEFESREPLTFAEGQLETVLADIPLARIDDYHDWTTLGAALHHQFGGSLEGFEIWKAASQRSSKFQERGLLRKYRSFGRNRRRPVTMATVVEWSQEGRTARLISMFDEVEDSDPAPAAAGDPFAAMLGGDPLGDFDDLTAAAVPSTLGEWVSLLQTNKEGTGIAPTLHNLELIACNDPRLRGLIQLNEFTLDPVQRSAPGTKANRRPNAAKQTRQLTGRTWSVKDPKNGDVWNDERDYAVRSILEAPTSQGGYGIQITDRNLHAATVLAASQHSFHPIHEYVESHVWDGVPRVETLFIDYLGCPDDPYHRETAMLTLVAAVTRIYEPGHKFDFCPILEGAQGKRKSTFISTLGGGWFAELGGDFANQKEMIEMMQGGWIMEIPELSGFARAEVQAIKSFISRQVDRARLAYAKRTGVFPRQCIFIGSTNDREYLKDNTGGRRFWPILARILKIDIDKLRGIVDQLWAEALVIYRTMRAEQPFGELPLYLRNPESDRIALELQESRRVESADDGRAGQIAAWLEKPIASGSLDDDYDDVGSRRYHAEVCLLQIWVECFGKDLASYTPSVAGDLGRAMHRITTWEADGKRSQFDRYGRQRAYRKTAAL